MRVGLVAEGRGDLAVLVNILKGALDLNFEDVQFIRPEYDLDETDLHTLTEAQRGGWVRVKLECVGRDSIREFVNNSIDEEILIVVHLDTAECQEKGYDVDRPARDDPHYSMLLRERVVAKVNSWLDGEGLERIRHAIAVEEIEAWVLTIFSPSDTAKHGDPKNQLRKLVNQKMSDKERKRHFQLKEYQQADALTRPFRKRRGLEDCAQRNNSLRVFVESLTPAEE